MSLTFVDSHPWVNNTSIVDLVNNLMGSKVQIQPLYEESLDLSVKFKNVDEITYKILPKDFISTCRFFIGASTYN